MSGRWLMYWCSLHITLQTGQFGINVMGSRFEITNEVMELYCVSNEVDFCFGLQQERLCKTDLSGLKLSVSIANPCSKLLCTEVKRSVLNI